MKESDVYIAGSLRHVPKEWWKIYEKTGKIQHAIIDTSVVI